MAVMDEFSKEREAIKNGTLKQKLQYFWDYYKWYVIIGALVLVMAVSFIRDYLSNKEHAFFAVFLNIQDETEAAADFWAEFAAKQGIDTEIYDVGADISLEISATANDEITLNSLQKIMIYTGAADLDVIAADSAAFRRYASTDYFYDLRDILTDEQLAKYQPYLYYADMDAVRAIEETADSAVAGKDTIPDFDPHAPETMKDPVPIAIYIQECPKLQGVYRFKEGDVPMGILRNTGRLENALAFLEYLFEE